MPAKKTTAKKATAKKTAATAKKPAPKEAAPPIDLRPLLASVAMGLAASKGWGAVSIAAIARASQQSEAQVRATFKTPEDVLLYLVQLADEANIECDAEGSVRDQLFELTMQRFDVLAPYREGIAAVEAAKGAWPKLACKLLPALLRSAHTMLCKAGVPAKGPVARLRQFAWLAVKADVARTWFKDDSRDLAQTMSALDQRLAQLEKVAEISAPWQR